MKRFFCVVLAIILHSTIAKAEVYLYDELPASRDNVRWIQKDLSNNNRLSTNRKMTGNDKLKHKDTEETETKQKTDIVDKKEKKSKENKNSNNESNKNKKDLFNIYANAGVGLTGVAVNGSVYFKNFIGIRVGYDFMPNQVLSMLNTTIEKASGNITGAKSSFHSIGIDASIRPFFGSFRIDAGLRIMNYSVSVDAFKGISNPYVNNAGAAGNAKFVIADGLKPYLGIGWDWNPILGLTIGLDLGVIFTGQWNMAKMDANVAYGDMSATQRALFDASYRAKIAEAKGEIEKVKKDVNDKIPNFLKIWPVVKLSVGWRFNI